MEPSLYTFSSPSRTYTSSQCCILIMNQKELHFFSQAWFVQYARTSLWGESLPFSGYDISRSSRFIDRLEWVSLRMGPSVSMATYRFRPMNSVGTHSPITFGWISLCKSALPVSLVPFLVGGFYWQLHTAEPAFLLWNPAAWVRSSLASDSGSPLKRGAFGCFS